MYHHLGCPWRTTGTYAAVNYGTNSGWGAAAHWEYPDMGFKKVPAAAKWHHIVVTFDGGVEKIYVDGKLDAQEQKACTCMKVGRSS